MNFLTVLICLVIGYASAAPNRHRVTNTYCGGKPAEIFFLLDSSSSIWSPDFDKQLEFLQNITDSFDISPTRTRIGVASFSYRYHENIALDQFETKEEVQEAMKHIRQYYGGTYTYVALDGVRTRGLSTDIVREGVVRIAIVITDGKSYNEKKTVEAATKLKASGTVVFAVGIGRNVDNDELKAIASEPAKQYTFRVGGYGLLNEIKEQLAMKACEVEAIKDEPQGPKCGAKNLADVMFVADPAEVGYTNMPVVYDFISDVMQDFNTQSGNIRVGLESRNCGAKNISLGKYADKHEMAKAIRNTNIPGISHMIRRLRTHAYTEENGGRIKARHMAVLFVDDKLYNAKDVLNEARRTKMMDVELFVVAIGDSIVEEELMTLCSSSADRHFMRVESYDELKNLKPEFLEKFCHGL